MGSAMSFKGRALSLLNKVAESNFASISGQIIALLDASAGEADGGTLRMFVELCISTAISQPSLAGLYARICGAISSELSPEVGGRLFRKMLLSQVQLAFEIGISSIDPETYFGLVRFIAEIFKVKLLTQRSIHECIKKLLATSEPSELAANIEAACILLDTGGSLLHTPKARTHMDVYYSRLREAALDVGTPLRIRFMIQDLCDRRSRDWPPVERGHRDHIIPMPLDPDPAGEHQESSDAERGLACLPPDYVPTLVKLLVEHVISTKQDHITSLVSRFLETAATKDLFLTSAAHLGFVLEESRLESDSVPHLRSMLDAAGLDRKCSDLLIEGALGTRSEQVPEELYSQDSEYLQVNSPEVATVFDKISAALSLPTPTISPQGRIQLTRFDDWLSQIEDLEGQCTRQRREMRDIQSTVERLSTQLSKELKNIWRVEQERDVMEKARNSEQMRRVELQEQLKARQAEAVGLEKNLRQVRDRCDELEVELQLAKENEKIRRNAEMADRKAAREEGRDSMLAEMIQLLHSKRESERQAQQAEQDRVDKEKAEKLRREAVAKRRAERIQGAERERVRCMKRDERFTEARVWTASLALERFETILLVEEFVKFKFSDSTPLIFEALPWPVLARPRTFTVDSITAENVRAFFRTSAVMTARSAAYPVPTDYRKYLLKQGLLALHGDKMVARIPTVDDDVRRQQIAEAAKIVTQTLNELMQHAV
ncbi:hypothetical protein B0H19DRAFT_1373205 [Mycena capillaripes]|nr:hypothetical protein B0H19DRAFT_1373205 [Mycena capillaripes]